MSGKRDSWRKERIKCVICGGKEEEERRPSKHSYEAE